MKSRSPSRVLTLSLALALGFWAVGCTTQVAVSPQGSLIAGYKWGTLRGDVKGDITNAFHAANHALDDLGYFRVGQETPKGEAHVYARGLKDVFAQVDITQAKDPAMVTIAISLDPSDLPKSQAILASILQQMGTGQPVAPAAPPAPNNSGLSAPTRMPGS